MDKHLKKLKKTLFASLNLVAFYISMPVYASTPTGPTPVMNTMNQLKFFFTEAVPYFGAFIAVGLIFFLVLKGKSIQALETMAIILVVLVAVFNFPTVLAYFNVGSVVF